MYFGGKLVYLIVRASNQLAVIKICTFVKKVWGLVGLPCLNVLGDDMFLIVLDLFVVEIPRIPKHLYSPLQDV